ncbi:unnamed protein product [Adineta ricciae]|uniref:Uncharacterized protein n=1 Tax=Adineta ricciae TaxID=249248 RepID=A0A814DKP0_ADIRI|nr:unnamed protein product [Adineta ricciae]CAF1089307.1 unnamed protein product [Adineta ricciae]
MLGSRFVLLVCALFALVYWSLNYKSLRLAYHADRYHGDFVSSGVFFEGWYFKLSFEELNYSVIVIPGVHRNDYDRFAFMMIAYNNISHYFRFPFESFHSSTDEFLATIGQDENIFSYDKMIVNIQPKSTDDASESFQMNLTLSSHLTIPDLSWLIPGTMGPFSWIPTMQCNHHVLSLKYQVQGSIKINHSDSMSVHGVGYLEKDWGYSFPTVWSWGQANQWENLPLGTSPPSLFFSFAMIPWYFNLKFPGFLIVFEHNGHFYRFNAYLLSVVTDLTADNTTDKVSFTVYDVFFQHKLRVSTHYDESANIQSALLYGPRDDRMEKFVKETLVNNIYFDVQLTRLIHNSTGDKNDSDLFVQHGYSEEIIFQGRAMHVALEINGDIQSLIQKFRNTFENVYPWNLSLGRTLIQYYKFILTSIVSIVVVRLIVVIRR